MRKLKPEESNIFLAESILRLAETIADVDGTPAFLKKLTKLRKEILK